MVREEGQSTPQVRARWCLWIVVLVVGAKWNSEDLAALFFLAVNMYTNIVVEDEGEAHKDAPPCLIHDVDRHQTKSTQLIASGHHKVSWFVESLVEDGERLVNPAQLLQDSLEQGQIVQCRLGKDSVVENVAHWPLVARIRI